MMEVWSMMGLAILNADFHRIIFEAAQEGDDFEEIKALRRILRVEMRMNLSRWEIMVLHRCITERNIDITLPPVKINSADEDPEIIPVRHSWKGATPQFPDNFRLCAVIGLASMDVKFRTNLIGQSDPDPTVGQAKLEIFLESPAEESPIFNLGQAERINLNVFLQDPGIASSLENLHGTRWVQPFDYPCNGGYTEGPTTYKFFPQSALNRLFDKSESIRLILTGKILPP
jgi:hypothetical protein